MKRICALMTALLLSLCLTGTVLAGYDGVFAYDPDGILTDAASLEEQASDLTDSYDCAVYLFTMEDFTLYGYEDIYELAQDYYEENLLGCGEGRDGILLTLSTGTRDVSLAVYGDWANAVFTDANQELVWDAVLDDFGNDDWDGGCLDYLMVCEELLAAGSSTPPVPMDGPDHGDQSGNVTPPSSYTEHGKVSPAVVGKAVVMSILPAVILAFVVCAVMKRNMKTARKASGAAAYVTGAVALKVREDHYTHSTVHRTPINRDNGTRSGGGHRGGGFSGGSSRNSRGFSGGSRKF